MFDIFLFFFFFFFFFWIALGLEPTIYNLRFYDFTILRFYYYTTEDVRSSPILIYIATIPQLFFEYQYLDIE